MTLMLSRFGCACCCSLTWSVFQDHGWQLGEKGEWGKHANYELAVHVPLMIRGKFAMLFSI